MNDLFGGLAKPASALRHDPRVHICVVCKKPNAPCGVGSAWYCLADVPNDWFPSKRGGAR